MKKERLGFPLVLLGSAMIGVTVGKLEPLLALPIFIGYCIVMLGIVLVTTEDKK